MVRHLPKVTPSCFAEFLELLLSARLPSLLGVYLCQIAVRIVADDFVHLFLVPARTIFPLKSEESFRTFTVAKIQKRHMIISADRTVWIRQRTNKIRYEGRNINRLYIELSL